MEFKRRLMTLKLGGQGVASGVVAPSEFRATLASWTLPREPTALFPAFNFIVSDGMQILNLQLTQKHQIIEDDMSSSIDNILTTSCQPSSGSILCTRICMDHCKT